MGSLRSADGAQPARRGAQLSPRCVLSSLLSPLSPSSYSPFSSFPPLSPLSQLSSPTVTLPQPNIPTLTCHLRAVAGPLPRLRLGFAAAPAITAATHTALAAGMVACAGYLCLCSSATTEMSVKKRRVGVGIKKVVERVDGSGGGGEERPLLPGSKQRLGFAPRSNSSSKPYSNRGTTTRCGGRRGLRGFKGMVALVKKSVKGIYANAAQLWSKDLVASESLPHYMCSLF